MYGCMRNQDPTLNLGQVIVKHALPETVLSEGSATGHSLEVVKFRSATGSQQGHAMPCFLFLCTHKDGYAWPLLPLVLEQCNLGRETQLKYCPLSKELACLHHQIEP